MFLDGSLLSMGMLGFCKLNQSHNFNEDKISITDDFLDFMPIYTLYTNVALSLSKIIFPEDRKQLDSEFNEKLLFYKGKSAVIRDSSKGFILCDFSVVDRHYNIFGKPTKINAIDTYNNQNIGQYNEEDFVIIENNPLWYPTNLTVLKASADLAETNQSAIANVRQQKFPIIFQGTNKQKLTFENLIEQIEKTYPYIFLDKEINVEDITKLMIDAKFIAKDLLDFFDRRKSMLLEMLGINNVGVVKQSGIGDEEISSNNMLTALIGDIPIKCKEKAIQELKEKFNLDCTLWVNPIILNGEKISSKFNFDLTQDGDED